AADFLALAVVEVGMIGPLQKPAYLPERIESERLVLRCYAPEDAEAFYEAINESRDHLRPWMPWADTSSTTLAEARASMHKHRGKFDLLEDLTMGIFRKEDGRYLGGTG